MSGTELRIGDAERDSAVGSLGDHFAAGRLSKEEFDERSDSAGRARTQSELDHLFADRAARRLYAYVEDDNLASQRVCERLGMRREGLFRDFISFVNDAAGQPIYVNTYQYALLRRERDG